MQRPAKERAVIQRRLRLARQLGLISTDSHPGVKSGGKFRKHAPLDCGERCHLCHGDKLLGIPSLADRRAKQVFRDELTALHA